MCVEYAKLSIDILILILSINILVYTFAVISIQIFISNGNFISALNYTLCKHEPISIKICRLRLPVDYEALYVGRFCINP